jgi:hypothetical protein
MVCSTSGYFLLYYLALKGASAIVRCAAHSLAPLLSLALDSANYMLFSAVCQFFHTLPIIRAQVAANVFAKSKTASLPN